MNPVRWHSTTEAVYNAVYSQHRNDLCVHGTITETGDYNGAPRIMTEWGLKGADYPLIKYDIRGDEKTFWIAAISKEQDE